MLFATVPAAPPTRKNQRTTSWPAPISANVPYQRGSRLILSALEWVSIASCFTESEQAVYQKARDTDSYMFVKSERFTATARTKQNRPRSEPTLPDIIVAYGPIRLLLFQDRDRKDVRGVRARLARA